MLTYRGLLYLLDNVITYKHNHFPVLYSAMFAYYMGINTSEKLNHCLMSR